MADYVDVALPHAPLTLISEEARRRVRAIAGQLPPCAIAGFECRFDEHEGQVDFQVGVARAPLRIDGEAWAEVARVCDAWSAAGDGPFAAIESVALEFDQELARNHAARHAPDEIERTAA